MNTIAWSNLNSDLQDFNMERGDKLAVEGTRLVQTEGGFSQSFIQHKHLLAGG